MELLVLITLLAILSIVGIAALTTQRRMIRRDQCASNLHALDMGIATIMLDSGSQPRSLEDCPCFGAILLKCPSDNSRRAPATIQELTNNSGALSSYNFCWSQLAAGSGSVATSAYQGNMFACDKNGLNDVSPAPDSFGGNHGGFGNVLFNNHSIKWIKSADWGTKVWGVTNWTELGPITAF